MENKNPTLDILNRWPSRSALASDVGAKLIAVHRWHQRSSIPAKYDSTLLDAASARNIPLNWRELMDARSASRDQNGQSCANSQDDQKINKRSAE